MLTSKWGLAVMALVLYSGLSGFLLYKSLPPPPDPSRFLPEKTDLPPRMWSFKTEAVDALIKELTTGREQAEEEKKTVIAMQAQVAAERAELEKARDEVKAMREEIEQRVIAIQQDEMGNLKTLSQTYSIMAPGSAVAILREMDENNAVKILSLMKTDRISAILGEMAKAADRAGEDTMAKRAARISDKLRLAKPVKKQAVAVN